MASEIKEYIHKKRPNLSASSLTTYASICKSMYKKCFGDGKIVWDKFDDADAVLKCLKDMPPNKRKTILSAMVIITDNAKYRELMVKDVRDYNKEINKQELTPEQKENWVSSKDIGDIFTDLKKKAELIMKKKSNIKPSDLQEIQNFIIVALLGGMYIPPRRSKDYCDFKIKNIEENKDNFLKKNEMIFNSYKTSKTYGTQKVKIEAPLTTILAKWIKMNPTDYLLFDSNMNQLSPVKLNQRFNKIFNGKISVNQMRHTFLTEKYGEHSKVDKELANDVAEMGTSKNMLTTYVKDNA
jgi:hypothetical protein